MTPLAIQSSAAPPRRPPFSLLRRSFHLSAIAWPGFAGAPAERRPPGGGAQCGEGPGMRPVRVWWD